MTRGSIDMRKALLAGAALLVMMATSQACPVRDLSSFSYIGNDCGDTRRFLDNASFLKTHGITFDGWLNGGIIGNADSPATGFNGPVGFADKDNGQFNQGYVSLARTAPKNNQGWFLGGRVDALYGSDFFFTTAAGRDGSRVGNTPRSHNPDFTYGLTVPQAYVEVDYNDLQVKAGHFYSIIGDESAMAKDNFFYTHSYAFMFGEPTADTGVLVRKGLNANWTLTAGVVNGWNQFAVDSTNGGQNVGNFLGGIAYANSRFGAAFNVQTGDVSDFNVPGVGPYSGRTLLNFVATVNITERLNYLIDALYGVQQESLGFNALFTPRAEWYGINQQLIYAINDKWSGGVRFEWFADPQGYVVTGLRPFNQDAMFRFPGNFYDVSLALNYKPIRNLTLRGELRYDWYKGQVGYVAPLVPGLPPNLPYADNTKSSQFLFGLDAIYQF
jgi:Putative beta-barrel porin-2, OmpL-like. bbp2